MGKLERLKARLEAGHEINEAACSMWVEGNRIEMSGSRWGNHSILRSSSEERIAAHWAGYLNNAARAAGLID